MRLYTYACACAVVQAIIYVVDSSDTERIGVSREEFHNILSEEELAGAKILVYANKQVKHLVSIGIALRLHALVPFAVKTMTAAVAVSNPAGSVPNAVLPDAQEPHGEVDYAEPKECG